MNEDIIYHDALSVLKRIRSAGFEAYFAGGCVRDRLLGTPPQDYDIATKATPDEVIKLFPKTVTTGKVFGVVNVIKEESQVEVTTFRTEGPYSDGRHPDEVKFSSLENDVQRRDYTINGMLYDPIEDKLIDLVGGQKDLKEKVIRAIGEPARRFAEDKLRMVRAIRFACELDFRIEKATLAAIKKQAQEITQVSVERIRDELKKILVSPHRDRGMELLDESGLLNEILPEVVKMKGVAQPQQFHPEGDVYTHTLLTLKHLTAPSWELAFATLLHDVGKPATFTIKDRIRFHEHERVGAEMAKEICDRLKLSNDEQEKIVWLIDRHMVFKDAAKMRVSTLKRLFRHPAYDELAELHKVDRLASDMDLTPYEFCKEMYEKLSVEELKPPPLINGHDLINLGLTPGPIFSKILKQVEEAQLEKQISTKEEALELARQIVKTLPRM